MDIRNYGTLHVYHNSKVSDKNAFEAVKRLFDEECIELGVFFCEDKMEVSFEEHPNSYLDDDLRNVQEGLKPDVWLDGNITYVGDYDGWIDVKRTSIETGDKSSEDLHYATDETLIDILEGRGYKVTKDDKATKKRGKK